MKKLLILGAVAILLSGGLVLASCDILSCPGGDDVSKGDCSVSFNSAGVGYGSQCTRECIYDQGTYNSSDGKYHYTGDYYSCNCGF